jgi:tetratricopeptide (TPR) repeat protein
LEVRRKAWRALDQGHPEECARDASEALVSKPATADLWALRAEARERLWDAKGALEDVARALASNPKQAHWLAVRGAARADLRDYAAALADAKLAARTDPSDALAQAISGEAEVVIWYREDHGAHDDPGDKDADLVPWAATEKAVALDPNLGRAWTARAIAQWHTGREDPSSTLRQLAQKAVELAPRNPWGHVLLARSMVPSLFTLEECRRAVEIDPESPVFRAELALGEYWLGKHDEALVDAAKSSAGPYPPATAFEVLAMVRVFRGELTKERGHLDRSLLEAAIADATSALALRHNAGYALEARARSRYLLGDTDGARADYRSCTHAMDWWAKPALELAQLYHELGNDDAALAVLVHLKYSDKDRTEADGREAAAKLYRELSGGKELKDAPKNPEDE